MITGPLKAELLEVFDQTLKDLHNMIGVLEEVAPMVTLADRDQRRSHSLLISELCNSEAQMSLVRRRIEEAKTFEDGRKKEQ